MDPFKKIQPRGFGTVKNQFSNSLQYIIKFLLIAVLLTQCTNSAKKVTHPQKKQSFVIVTASYNNEEYCEKNLASLLSQEYDNFRIIYIDDASTDRTYEKVERYIQEQGACHKVELIHNAKRQKALHNLYKAIHSCKDDDIILICDGDDWLPHTKVLSDLNHYYGNKNLWISYGQYIHYPEERLGICEPVKKKFLAKAKMRSGPWHYSHLRSFYAGLFKRIRLEDLMQEGEFFPVACDVAMMFPMLEMARTHAYFIPEILYVYNWENPLCDQKIREQEQLKAESYLRSLPVYPKLKMHPATPLAADKCDLVIFSYNRPMQLYALLESTQKQLQGLENIYVLLRSDEEFQEGYREVKRAFPHVQFAVQPEKSPKTHFKPLLLDLLFGKAGKETNYILFAVDDIILTEEIDLKKDMATLSRTNAYALYYRCGKNIHSCYMTKRERHSIPPLVDIGEDLYAWQFEQGEEDWRYPHSLDFALFRKSDLKKDFEEIPFTYPTDLEGIWATRAPLQRVGLCHGHSKMINIPMNVVSGLDAVNEKSFSVKELNQLFANGFKIDIQPLIGIDNHSPHIGLTPQFIER
jgi:hypothetical protein